MNLETDEEFFLDSYFEAVEFAKGKKDRWYIISSGVRRSNEDSR